MFELYIIKRLVSIIGSKNKKEIFYYKLLVNFYKIKKEVCMGISRVQKFKEYRNSLIKEDSPILNDNQNNNDLAIKSSATETTSTLPLDQVISAIEEDNSEAVFVKRARRQRIITYVIIGVGLAAVIALMIIFGIMVFK